MKQSTCHKQQVVIVMDRYKQIDTSPRFIAVDLERQLLPGSFEHALNHLVDHELDLSGFAPPLQE